jgi:SAM-dependent methyltransferase
MHTIVNTHQAEAWNGYEGRHWADHQDRYDALNAGLNGPLLAAAAIGAAERVLDVGCGTGQLTRLAARAATGGRVVGVDLSAPMLDRARRTARAEGLTNVTFEQGDAQVHPFPAGGYDVAVSRGGIMYFADPVAAFANLGHALAPGGRLRFVCARGSGGEQFGAVWAAMAAHVPLPDAAEDHEPGPASFTDGDTIAAVLAEAGFTDGALEPIETEMDFGPDPEDAARFVFGWGPVRFWLRDADPAAADRAREAVAEALRPFHRAGSVVLRSTGWLASAGWPGR